MNADLRQYIEEVARALLGEPNKRLSKQRELRFGTHGSIAVDLDKGTWFDHENKTGGGVLDLITMRMGKANGDALKWLRDELGIEIDQQQDHKRRIAATYDYLDEKGKLLFQVVRYDPKDFRQRRPDGHGGWIWSVKTVRTVPYHLPEMLEAGDRTIFVCEGEKAVEALRGLGLLATCGPGGAGKWRDKWATYFAGSDVAILPDNDEAGRKHADLVARSIVTKAQSIRVVELPGLPQKGDASGRSAWSAWLPRAG